MILRAQPARRTATIVAGIRPGRERDDETILFWHRGLSTSDSSLGTSIKALQALHDDDVDVVALDSFFLDLCRYHDPTTLAGIRCVATTAWTPIPLLVAAPGVDEAVISPLRNLLLAIDREPSYAPLLADVLLKRFVAPDVASYFELESQARNAIEAGYEEIR